MIRHNNILRSCLVALAAATALTSCLKDQEDYFDTPASERLQNKIEQVKQTLRSSPYGWEFEYYPGSELAYGGIVYTVRFDSLTATVGCSLMPDSTETTFYRVTNDNGPVLTFDTYNRLLHYFSTPSTGEYEAKGGEFEFVVNDVTDTLITLYGKKTRNTMYLRRFTHSADDYAAKTVAMYDSIAAGFTGTVGGTPVEGRLSIMDKQLTVDAAGVTATVPFAFTDRGIHLYRPLSIGGVAVQTLAYDIRSDRFTCLDPGAHDVELHGVPSPDGVVRFADYAGKYTLRYSGRTTVSVTLVPSRMDGTYRLRGLSPKFELVLNYDRETGNLTLAPQIVGDINGASVYLLTFSSTTGRVWLNDAASLTLTWNKSIARVAYQFSATNPDLYPCDSAILYMIYYDEEGNASAKAVTDPEWLVNGSAMLTALTSLQRQNR